MSLDLGFRVVYLAENWALRPGLASINGPNVGPRGPTSYFIIYFLLGQLVTLVGPKNFGAKKKIIPVPNEHESYHYFVCHT